jgi:outer membrane receptor protein involved in Fe transport
VNAGLAYQHKPSLTLSLDVGNVFNAAQATYRGISDQMAETILPGTSVTLGVSGRF